MDIVHAYFAVFYFYLGFVPVIEVVEAIIDKDGKSWFDAKFQFGVEPPPRLSIVLFLLYVSSTPSYFAEDAEDAVAVDVFAVVGLLDTAVPVKVLLYVCFGTHPDPNEELLVVHFTFYHHPLLASHFYLHSHFHS